MGQHYSLKDFRQSRLSWVIALNFLVMLLELVGGSLTGSMALYADGFHMLGHVLALGIAYSSYYLSRHPWAQDYLTFGVNSISSLGGFLSGLILLWVGADLLIESIGRLSQSHLTDPKSALGIAILGLLVNGLSLWLLHSPKSCDHNHHVHKNNKHNHHDHNYRGVIGHLLADILTSVLAIISLSLSLMFGHIESDAWVGILGSLVILKWSLDLVKNAGLDLLHRRYHQLEHELALLLKSYNFQALKVWRANEEQFYVMIAVDPEFLEDIKVEVKKRKDIKEVFIYSKS